MTPDMQVNEIVQEEIITYAQTWSDEYQTLAQKIVSEYMERLHYDSEDRLTEEDIQVLDETIFNLI